MKFNYNFAFVGDASRANPKGGNISVLFPLSHL